MAISFLRQCFLVVVFLIVSCTFCQAQYAYPKPVRATDKIEKFGHSIEDPYRWLENIDGAQTQSWLQAQNELLRKYRNNLFADYTVLERELYYTLIGDTVSNYIKQKIGAYYFTTRYVAASDNSPSILFKPKISYGWDKLIGTAQFLRSDKDVISVSFISVSPNDSLAVIGISHSGSDWRELHVVDIKNKKLVDEKIDWVKGGFAWGKKGFFYKKYEKPSGDNEVTALATNCAVYYHKIGSSADMRLSDLNPSDKTIYTLEDNQYLILFEEKQISGREIGICSYISTEAIGTDTLKPFLMTPGLHADDFSVVGKLDSTFLVHTNYKAPKGRVMLYDYSKLNSGRVFIDMYNQNLLEVHWLKHKLICTYMDKGNNLCYVFDSTGKLIKNVSIPSGVSIDGFDKTYKDSITFYYINSFAMPRVTIRFNLNTLRSELADDDAGFALSSKYITKVVSYKSKDSTDVYMYLTYNKDLKPESNAPVLIYAYGGFGVSTRPEYNPMYGMLLKRNAIVAVPLVRGGGEFGKDWHNAGRKANKQNSVDDLAFAAKWLIENGYSNKDKIVTIGGSQGGWLVAETMVQYPEYFKATVPEAGVYDLLRFHLYSVTGAIGYDEFGNPEDSTEFNYLTKVSPYHNIKKGVSYPACLVTTGTHDDRVVPFHSYKLVASLQENGNINNPYLLYLEENAGHNLSSTNEGFQQIALIYTFILTQLGLDVKK